MTVSSTTSRNQYTATSGQTVFPYTFEIFNKDDVTVLSNGSALSEGTDYTVSGVGNENGGNITLTTGANTGTILTIYRDMALSRDTDYQTSGDFLASEVNNDFDRLWLASQQNADNFTRAIRKPLSDLTSLDMELPPASTRANSYFTFGNDGEIDLRAISDTSVTSGINIYVDDYGAVGDGVTDDTAAIKSAIAAAFATASNYDKYIYGNDTFRKTGSLNIVFGNRKVYKVTETLDLQGAQGIDTGDGVGNYYGCNVTVDFGGSTILPAPKDGTIPNPALIMWGQSSEFKRLRLDFTKYNTDQEVYDQQVVGVAITPTLGTEISTGGAEAYNCVYEQIEIFGTWRGFELKQNLAFSYRNRWSQCQVRGCSDYGWYMKGDPLVGDNTTNVLSQCHVNAAISNIGFSNGGVNYLCVKAHDPALVDAEPGVGADWLDYWADNSENAPYPTVTYPAWSGTADFYLSSGGGYYFDACGGISFDATTSMDSVIVNPDKPGIYFKSRFLSITGGLHLERNRVLVDDAPLILIGGGTGGRGGDVFIDAIYTPNPYYAAPNRSLLIGGMSADPARSLFLNSAVELIAGGTDTNRYLCDVTYIDSAQFGAGIFSSTIIGENNGFVFVPQDITAIRQFKEQTATSGSNCIFTPSSIDSGTHYRFNTGAAYYQEMDLSGTASTDIVDGAYFEMVTVNSGTSYSDAAGQSRVTGTGTNVYGPTVAKNGQTLCIQKQDNVFLTWIKPTSGYNPSLIKSVYTQKLDEYTVVGGLPPASRFQGHIIMVTDETGGYVPAFCDGTNWRRVTDRAVVS